LKVTKAKKKKNGKSVRREWMKADLKIKDHSTARMPGRKNIEGN
jgi:hypothetical protein